MSDATPYETIRDLLFGPIIAPLVLLLMAVAFIYFMYGVARYIISGENPEERKTGARHMFWGIVGLAIMLSAFGIATFLFNTASDFGGNKGLDDKPIDTPSILKPENQNF